MYLVFWTSIQINIAPISIENKCCSELSIKRRLFGHKTYWFRRRKRTMFHGPPTSHKHHAPPRGRRDNAFDCFDSVTFPEAKGLGKGGYY